jgi:hypothetical protein
MVLVAGYANTAADPMFQARPDRSGAEGAAALMLAREGEALLGRERSRRGGLA